MMPGGVKRSAIRRGSITLVIRSALAPLHEWRLSVRLLFAQRDAAWLILARALHDIAWNESDYICIAV